MSKQNLVSGVLSTEALASINQNLSQIREQLTFSISLSADEMRSLFKAGNGYKPFLDVAFTTAAANPGILPGVFDRDEYRRDYELAVALSPILSQLKELTESVNATLTALNSDLITDSLDVYSAAKLNQDKVPGLKASVEEMSVFFKRTRRKPETVGTVAS